MWYQGSFSPNQYSAELIWIIFMWGNEAKDCCSAKNSAALRDWMHLTGWMETLNLMKFYNKIDKVIVLMELPHHGHLVRSVLKHIHLLTPYWGGGGKQHFLTFEKLDTSTVVLFAWKITFCLKKISNYNHRIIIKVIHQLLILALEKWYVEVWIKKRMKTKEVCLIYSEETCQSVVAHTFANSPLI